MYSHLKQPPPTAGAMSGYGEPLNQAGAESRWLENHAILHAPAGGRTHVTEHYACCAAASSTCPAGGYGRRAPAGPHLTPHLGEGDGPK